MNKKVYNLIIATIILIILILCLIIFKLVISQTKAEPEPTETELEQTVIESPTDDYGFKVHTSENGYTVKYPEKYTAMRMAKAVDFILTDENSGSSINIVTAKNDGTLKEMSEEDFLASILQSDMDIKMLSYEKTTLNNTPATIAKYLYGENTVTQAFIILKDKGYNITVTKSEYISESVSKELDDILNSFTLN